MALIFAAATVLILLALAGIRLWTIRSHQRVDVPVTEAQARAHALPLSTSVLTITPRARDGADPEVKASGLTPHPRGTNTTGRRPRRGHHSS